MNRKGLSGFLLATLTLCWPSASTSAQPSARAIVNQSVQWAAITSSVKLSPGSILFLDVQPRFAANPGLSNATEPMQLLLRGHAEFVLKGKLTFAPVGYARIWNQMYGKQPASFVNHEHRLYQQLAFSHLWGKASVNHRLRSEERFIQDKDQAGNDLGYTNRQLRLRYRLLMNYPLSGDKIEAQHFFATAFYEGFLSRGELVTFQDIDQNRLYMGIGYQLSNNLSINMGWFYQMLVKANGGKQENNIGLLVMLNQNFDLTKKND